MNYFVIAVDGQKYGPAGIDVLNQWIREGRLYPTTMLEPEAGGPQMPASSVEGLNFPTAQATPTMEAPAGTQSSGSFGAATGAGTGAASSPYAQYPRGSVAYGGDLPDDVKRKFNWGAFLLTWIWGLNHKQPILLLALILGFIPVVGGFASLGFSIWAGINGNQWAWQSGRFSTIQEMEDCQVIWAKWGVGILIASIVLCFASFLLIGIGSAVSSRG